MRGTNRPGERNASGVARHLAIGRIVLVLAALMSMMLLSPACSKEAATSAGAADLEQALDNGKPTLAGFVGKVCACKNITPTLEELAAEYDGKCNVLILEKDDNNELFGQYGILLVPTLVYFDGSGTEVKRIMRASTKEEMVEQLAGMGVAKSE